MKKINIVLFFDEGLNNLFEIMYKSVKKVYGESYKLFIGTNNGNDELIEKFKSDENIIFKKISDNKMSVFSKDGLFGTITDFTFARFLIEGVFSEELNGEKFIYTDVDIIHRKRIDEYLNLDSNIASTNIEDSNTMLPIAFWNGHLRSRGKRFGEEVKFNTIADSMRNKMLNKDYFNAGVLIINDPASYFKLVKRIMEDPLDLLNKLDDQTLLNVYNKNEIKTLSDSNINFKVTKDNNFENQSIIHFLGPTKYIMRRVYNGGYDFEILKNIKKNFRRITLILEINEQCEKSAISYAKALYKKYKDEMDILFFVTENINLKWVPNEIRLDVRGYANEEFEQQKEFINEKVITDLVWVVNLNRKKRINFEELMKTQLNQDNDKIFNLRSSATGLSYMRYINPDTLLIPKWIYESELSKDAISISDMVKKYLVKGENITNVDTAKTYPRLIGEKDE